MACALRRTCFLIATLCLLFFFKEGESKVKGWTLLTPTSQTIRSGSEYAFLLNETAGDLLVSYPYAVPDEWIMITVLDKSNGACLFNTTVFPANEAKTSWEFDDILPFFTSFTVQVGTSNTYYPIALDVRPLHPGDGPIAVYGASSWESQAGPRMECQFLNSDGYTAVTGYLYGNSSLWECRAYPYCDLYQPCPPYGTLFRMSVYRPGWDFAPMEEFPNSQNTLIPMGTSIYDMNWPECLGRAITFEGQFQVNGDYKCNFSSPVYFSKSDATVISTSKLSCIPNPNWADFPYVSEFQLVHVGAETTLYSSLDLPLHHCDLIEEEDKSHSS